MTVTPTTQTIPTTHTTRTTRTVARRRTAAPAALAAMLITAAGLVAPPAYAQDEADSRQSAWRFHTEPDLTPPRINTVTQANGTAPGEIFLAPLPKQDAAGQPGKLIVDDRGDPVWFAPNEPGVATQDFKMQTYRGDPVLTYWEGNVVAPPGYGEGEAVIMDSSYREIARLQLGGGLQADLHDVVLTERGTALLLGYEKVARDLTPVGGPADGSVFEGVVQEVDIDSGEVLFEWRSLADVGLDESFLPLPEDPSSTWDYFHVNSVQEDRNDGLLISARNTHAVYRLDKNTGKVDWRLGGKRSDFRMGEGTTFEWAHDARRRPNGTITLFDNGAPPKDRSRAITLDVDENAGTASLAGSLERPKAALSPNMGNYQAMPGGKAFVGWGGSSGYTEYHADGSVALDAEIADGMNSYRSFRKEWTGTPTDDPEVAGVVGQDGPTDVYASWNGATEVASWRFLAGDDRGSLEPAGEVPRTGFETKLDLPADADPAYVAVEALDSDGRVLGRSPAEPVE